ncbi:hypothetical protein ABZP36_003400 [Zizania latifolia]
MLPWHVAEEEVVGGGGGDGVVDSSRSARMWGSPPQRLLMQRMYVRSLVWKDVLITDVHGLNYGEAYAYWAVARFVAFGPVAGSQFRFRDYFNRFIFSFADLPPCPHNEGLILLPHHAAARGVTHLRAVSQSGARSVGCAVGLVPPSPLAVAAKHQGHPRSSASHTWKVETKPEEEPKAEAAALPEEDVMEVDEVCLGANTSTEGLGDEEAVEDELDFMVQEIDVYFTTSRLSPSMRVNSISCYLLVRQIVPVVIASMLDRPDYPATAAKCGDGG